MSEPQSFTPDAALAYIHGILRFGSKPGLLRIRLLLEELGNPHKKLRFVHIAGTNGKGSTSAMTESMLRAAGYKTGLFVSPYLLRFEERIQVNRREIPGEALAAHTLRVKQAVDRMLARGEPQPSEFEVVTAIGFLHFLQEGCDIVVLEVGMGGRLDSTNIIDSCEVAAITSVSLDHTEYLGRTVLETQGLAKQPTHESVT